MKITDLIDGYETMTPEEQQKAIAEFDYEPPKDLSEELKTAKAQRDQFSSQIAEFKRKEKEGLSEAERIKSDYEESLEELNKKYNDLLKETTISNYATKFATLGFDETEAKKVAKHLANGEMDSVFASLESNRKNLEKKVKAELTKQTPPPDDKGDPSKVMTKEKFRKLSPAERAKYASEHPEDYRHMYGE